MMTYVYLATGCLLVGIAFTYLLLLVCRNLEIDIISNIWLLALPAILSIFVNILFIELLQRRKRK